MKFLSPTWLWLFVAVAALLGGYVYLQLRRSKYVARFSNLELLGSVAPRRPGWRRHLTFALLLAGLCVLTIGVARPSAAVRVARDRATVVMAIDVSLSMQASDVLPTRLEAAQQAAKSFVDILPARINLGLVSFGGNASALVAPTVDRDVIKVAIDKLQLQESTAIGEAVFTSLDAVRIFSQATTAKGDKPPPARIVLLSDGANNKGRTVSEAVLAARKAGVQVSTIAFGTDTGTVTVDGRTIPVPADTITLSRLARDTGGSYHAAHSVQELESVYSDIGTQIGYTTQRRDVSWRFLAIGLLFALAAGGTSMLWAGRLM
ncbi:MAG: VWA domain-containing protein [Pseudonocardiales bacterium]|nr:MAG: VWA domain-containing protein [Pseudonocardiales bacterium]